MFRGLFRLARTQRAEHSEGIRTRGLGRFEIGIRSRQLHRLGTTFVPRCDRDFHEELILDQGMEVEIAARDQNILLGILVFGRCDGFIRREAEPAIDFQFDLDRGKAALADQGHRGLRLQVQPGDWPSIGTIAASAFGLPAHARVGGRGGHFSAQALISLKGLVSRNGGGRLGKAIHVEPAWGKFSGHRHQSKPLAHNRGPCNVP